MHATAVAVDQKGLLLIGPSGAGKSSTAAQMIALGAELISDDQVALRADGRKIHLSAPDNGPQMIELRGIGLVDCPLNQGETILAAAVTLDQAHMPARLPDAKKVTLCDQEVPHRRLCFAPDLGARLMLWLRALS